MFLYIAALGLLTLRLTYFIEFIAVLFAFSFRIFLRRFCSFFFDIFSCSTVVAGSVN